MSYRNSKGIWGFKVGLWSFQNQLSKGIPGSSTAGLSNSTVGDPIRSLVRELRSRKLIIVATQKKKKKNSTVLNKKEKNAVPNFWEKQARWAGRWGLGYLDTIGGSDWCPAHKPDLSGLSRLEKTELGNSGGTIFPPLHWWQQEFNVMRGREMALVYFVNKWLEQ